jgi:metal-responsive CopG/Arc/MetJ family transcriptional regulator
LWYISSMKSSIKQKTSITLSREVLAGIDRLAGSKHSRSAVIEHAVRRYLRQREADRIYAHDLKILNEAADRLNAEAQDVLKDQADL